MIIDSFKSLPTSDVENTAIEFVAELPNSDRFTGRLVLLTAGTEFQPAGLYVYMINSWINIASADFVNERVMQMLSMIDPGAVGNVYTKEETDALIQGLIGTAPELLNTFEEVATRLAADETGIAAILEALVAKAPQETTYTKTEVDALLAAKIVPYDVAGAVFGKPSANAPVLMFVTPRDFTIPANFDGSVAKATAAAAASSVFTLNKNGVAVGTFTFAPLANAATFSAQDAIPFVAGDVLTITSSATQDATLSNVAFSIKVQ